MRVTVIGLVNTRKVKKEKFSGISKKKFNEIIKYYDSKLFFTNGKNKIYVANACDFVDICDSLNFTD